MKSRSFQLSKAFCTLSFVVLGFAHCSSLFAAGVAVFKEQEFHADSAANPIAYVDIIDSGGPFIKVNTGKRELSIDRSKYVDRVDVLSALPAVIATEAELEPLRKAFTELSDFSKRYAKSAPILKGHINAMEAHINKFESGEVRYSQKWITREAYNAIQAENQEKVESIRNIELARDEERRIRREKEEAFAADQRAKGLEQYGNTWLPKDEVISLRRRDAEIAMAWDSIRNKTVADALYSIFQVANDGMLIEFHRGRIKQVGVNTGIAFLFGAAKGMAAEGDFYKGTLYWCGTYSYTTYAGYSKTVNAYSLNKTDAIQRVRNTLGGSDAVAGRESGSPGAERNASSSNTPEPLVGASSCGSGFFVGNEGYFVTNAHVVGDESKVIIYYEGQQISAEVIKVSKVADLALLKVKKSVDGISISAIEAEPGQDVYAIGFPQPMIQGLEVKVTKGVISSSKGFGDDDTRFQIDAAVQPGNSGGPLCDEAGQLVGVVVSGLDQIAIANATGTIPQNVNYAIKASEVSALLRAKSIKLENGPKENGESGSGNTIKSACSKTGMVIIR